MLGTITLTVGQPDGVSVAQKEEAPETTDTIPDEVTPQVNGEKVDKESSDANDITSSEEKGTDDKSEDAGDVSFKKIFTIVGLKFTLKKDKSEEMDPVQLLTVKEGEDVSEMDESAKYEEEANAKQNSITKVKEDIKEASTAEPEVIEDKTETTEASSGGAAAAEASNETAKEEEPEKEPEKEAPPPLKETGLSPFRKLFFVGLFSNLRKKAIVKKTKEEEEKEAAAKEEAAKAEETAAEKKEKETAEKEIKEDKDAVVLETKENAVIEEEIKGDAVTITVEEKSENATSPEKDKSGSSPEASVDSAAPENETKQEDQKLETSGEEVTSENDLQSSQEKTKQHGSPLKKLFTGAGLKKLSTKRQRNKKESDARLTDSGEQSSMQLQSSTESDEAPKSDIKTSSTESGEHVVAEVTQNESSQEIEEVMSDGEKKKDGVIASFKKFVTPKRYVKKSDSEDEGDKAAKSTMLSSSESAPLAEESAKEEETNEENTSEEEPKTEIAEKITSSTEETKKKMDTSVSWEALMCMGGPKKRTRRTSDSDEEEINVEEEPPKTAAEVDQEGKNEDAGVTSQSLESDMAVAPAPATPSDPAPTPVPEPVAVSVPEPEPVIAPAAPAPAPAPEPVSKSESPWSTLKRLVMVKNKPKVEEKPEEKPSEQVQPETEPQKDESSFSLRKFFPGRRKKVVEKQVSIDHGAAEEDSETPAVVPLSEFEEPAEPVQEVPAEQVTVQSTASAEDRAPSWIPAIVEDVDETNDQLSDIPEEVNLATPKSVVSESSDDEDEGPPTPPIGQSRTGRRLSTAEVKPVTPTPAAATTPVPLEPSIEAAQKVVSSIEPQISEIPSQSCAAIEDITVDTASATNEYEPPLENAKPIINTMLEPHACNDATAICIGLGTKEIPKVAVEEPISPIVESSVVVIHAVSQEVAVQKQSFGPEKAAVTEDPIFKAHVQRVKPLKLEPVVNKTVGNIDVEAARQNYEPEIEKVGVVSIENSEVIQPRSLKANSPKTTVISPIAPTLERPVSTQAVHVSEVSVETKAMRQHSASKGNTPVREVARAVTQEASSTIGDTEQNNNIEGTVRAMPAVVPNEETAVVMETVVLVAPDNAECNQKAKSGKAKQAAVSEPVKKHKGKKDGSKKKEKVKKDTHDSSEIESRSVAIAQSVIQDAVDKVSEDATKQKKPATPSATIPKPMKAKATREEEVEIENEELVITDTPVPLFCEKPAKKSPKLFCVAMEVDSVPIEMVDEEEEEHKKKKTKPQKGLMKAEQVHAGEEIVFEEEVAELMADGKQSNRGNKTSPSRERKIPEIHLPVQVVLNAADVIEDPPVKVETLAGYDNGLNSSATAESPSRQKKLPVLSEEPHKSGSARGSSPSRGAARKAEKKQSAKCAEVMAQVIEVIEEAVKDIDPTST